MITVNKNIRNKNISVFSCIDIFIFLNNMYVSNILTSGFKFILVFLSSRTKTHCRIYFSQSDDFEPIKYLYQHFFLGG